MEPNPETDPHIIFNAKFKGQKPDGKGGKLREWVEEDYPVFVQSASQGQAIDRCLDAGWEITAVNNFEKSGSEAIRSLGKTYARQITKKRGPSDEGPKQERSAGGSQASGARSSAKAG